MKKFLVVFLGLTLTLSWISSPAESGQTRPAEPAYVPREMIICFQPNVPLPVEGPYKGGRATRANDALVALDDTVGVTWAQRIAPLLPKPADQGAALDRVRQNGGPRTLQEVAAIFSAYAQDRTMIVGLAADVNIPGLARDLMRRYPEVVEFAEPDFLRRLCETPNDPLFPEQWYLRNIEAERAWDETTGSAEVAIAIIDSGVSPHPDLDDKRFINRGEIPDNGLDDDENGFIDDVSGWDFFRRDNDPDDEFDHGTQVAGVAAAATNNGRDVAGLSWGAQILPLKAGGNDGFLTCRAILRAINYATMMATQGVRVINMSFSGEGRNGSELNAIRAANAANILCVAAAGNEGRNSDLLQSYPAGFELEADNLIAAAATNRLDRLTFISNFGLSVGVAAPGDQIVTTRARGGTITNRGTSFAAPIVSGVAALISSSFPQSTPLQVRGRIEGNVDEIEALNGKVLSGGRVNAARVFEIDDIPPAPITDLQVIEAGDGMALTWTASGDDEMEGRASFYDIRVRPSAPITPNDIRFTRRLVTPLRPADPGTPETLLLPEDFPVGRSFLLIRVLDDVGNLAESDQVEINIEN